MSQLFSNPRDCRPPGSSVHRISQAKILEPVTISSSKDLSDPGIKFAPLLSPALAGGFLTSSATWKALRQWNDMKIIASAWIEVLLFGNFFPNIFNLWLVDCVDLKPEAMECQLYLTLCQVLCNFFLNNKYNISHVLYWQEARILVVGTRQNRWNNLKIKQYIMKH